MSINQLSAQPGLRATTAISALRSSAAYAPQAAQAPTRQPDAVELSANAKLLAEARKAVSGASDVREDRIAELRGAIADGTYTVDSRQLARAMAARLGGSLSNLT
jgi:negative regulator of flagellin synthesis FlgM